MNTIHLDILLNIWDLFIRKVICLLLLLCNLSFLRHLFLPGNIEWSLIARETSRIVIQISWKLKIKLGPRDVTQLVEFLPGLYKAKTRASLNWVWLHTPIISALWRAEVELKDHL